MGGGWCDLKAVGNTCAGSAARAHCWDRSAVTVSPEGGGHAAKGTLLHAELGVASWKGQEQPPPFHPPTPVPNALVLCGALWGVHEAQWDLVKRRHLRQPRAWHHVCEAPAPPEIHMLCLVCPPPPLCDLPSGCCSFPGARTVTRSSLRMLRRVAAFCRPLRPVLLLVSFPRSRSPVVGVLGLC